MRSGPPPDPNALSRDRPSDQASWTTLPAAGRSGELPRWPLLEQSDREAHHWRELWQLPQAVMWERLGQHHEVALFVRTLAEAEAPDAPLGAQRLVRSYLDSLGLSVQGILRNRWRIVGDISELEKPAAPDASPPARTRRRSARDRMKIVPHGEAGG